MKEDFVTDANYTDDVDHICHRCGRTVPAGTPYGLHRTNRQVIDGVHGVFQDLPVCDACRSELSRSLKPPLHPRDPKAPKPKRPTILAHQAVSEVAEDEPMKATTKPDLVEVYPTDDGQWRWTRYNGYNHEPVSQATESYVNKGHARQMAVKLNPLCTIVILDKESKRA